MNLHILSLRLVILLAPLLLAACASQPGKSSGAATVPPAPTFQQPAPAGGGFYLDDGPASAVPVDLARVPDAVPRTEPLHRFANRPYTVLGRHYVPQQARVPLRQEGIASWYGRRYHGQKTASGEIYDMFGMTAAHPTLPIPSYVRVTEPESGKAVVVRINDRGPFLHERIIDLSYVAAWKLDLISRGSGRVVVETVFAGDTAAPVLAAETRPVAAAPVLEDRIEPGGHYLQLGAFSSRDNAESLKARLAPLLDGMSGMGDKLLIRSSANLHRVQLGPWRDGDEARQIAEQLQVSLALPSILVK
jgi:rare lipoprotein A